MFSYLCATLAGAVVVLSLTGKHYRLVLLILFFAGCVVATTALKFRYIPGILEPEPNGARYFYIPRLALVWCAMNARSIVHHTVFQRRHHESF